MTLPEVIDQCDRPRPGALVTEQQPGDEVYVDDVTGDNEDLDALDARG